MIALNQVAQDYNIQIVLQDSDAIFVVDLLDFGKSPFAKISSEAVFQQGPLSGTGTRVFAGFDTLVLESFCKAKRKDFSGNRLSLAESELA